MIFQLYQSIIEKIWKFRFSYPLNDLESFKMDKKNYLKEIEKDK